jgi:4-hydroxythreonine-4-phosphate dehydrogenase
MSIPTMSLPTIGITMGDAAGVGPEIIAKTLADPAWYERCRPLVIGDASIVRRAMSVVHSTQQLRTADEVGAWHPDAAFLDVDDLHLLAPDDAPFGELSARAGDAAFRYLERAVERRLGGRSGQCPGSSNDHEA